MTDSTSDLLLLAGVSLYVAAAVQVPVLLKKKNLVSKETARELVHSLAGLSVLTLPHFQSLMFPLALAGTGVLATFLSRPNSKLPPLRELYNAIGEPAEEGVGYLQGPFHYALAITVLVALFTVFLPDKISLAIAAILLMIISDPVASSVGRRWGKVAWPFRWTGSRRTVLGSGAFLVSALAVCGAYLWIRSQLGSGASALTAADVLMYTITAAIAGTVIEVLSPSTYDDLTVPAGSAALMVLVGLMV